MCVCVYVCEVYGSSTHQGGFDANALSGLESQGQIPDLKKNKPLGVETLRNVILQHHTQRFKQQQ